MVRLNAPTCPGKLRSKKNIKQLRNERVPHINSRVEKRGPKSMLLDNTKPLYVERPNITVKNQIKALAGHYYYDQAAQKIKLKKAYSNKSKLVIDSLSEAECIAMAQKILYPAGQIPCPHCQSHIKDNYSWKDYYRCGNGKKKFNWKTNTYFMHSNLSVKKSLAVMMKLFNDRKGISSHELGREEEITQGTAWRQLRKLKKYLLWGQLADQKKFKGPVHYDEKTITKTKFTGLYDRQPGGSGKRIYRVEKAIIAVLYDAQSGKFRHLTVRANDANRRTIITNWIRDNVAEKSILLTDAMTSINSLKADYNMMKVNHGLDEYVRKSEVKVYYKDDKEEQCDLLVTNNRVEGFWAKFQEQKNVTFQHRFDLKNISYYLADTVKRLNPDGLLENGLGVALTAIISACRSCFGAYNQSLHKAYEVNDYIVGTRLRAKGTFKPIPV